jgi:hypothetical protein
MSPLPELRLVTAGCGATASPPAHFAVEDYLESPVVLRHQVGGKSIVVAEGPLGAIAQAMLCMSSAQRNEFTISFAFPLAPAAADACLEQEQ